MAAWRKEEVDVARHRQEEREATRLRRESNETEREATISRKIPGSLGFSGCALLALLRPVPPTLAPSLQRSRSVPRPVVLDVQFLHSPSAVRVGNVPALR